LHTEIPAHINKEKMLLLLHGRISKLSEIDEKIAFFLSLPEYDASLFFNKKNKVTDESAKEILGVVLPALEAVTEWNNDTLYAALLAIAEKMGIKSGAVMWAVRIAAAGLAVTPGGATEIMEVLGKDESLRRIRIALTK
jgi:glutamyl-tRNA synthetase